MSYDSSRYLPEKGIPRITIMIKNDKCLTGPDLFATI